jgi:hypothetical protein
MVDSNRIREHFNKSKLNMENAHDFKKWIDDNKGKAEDGCDAMQTVMSIGTDIASAAAVKWFRERGRQQAWVSDRVSRVSELLLERCNSCQESVIRDCASLFAGTSNVMMVMMMAFVAYSIIGVQVAETLIGEDE